MNGRDARFFKWMIFAILLILGLHMMKAHAEIIYCPSPQTLTTCRPLDGAVLQASDTPQIRLVEITGGPWVLTYDGKSNTERSAPYVLANAEGNTDDLGAFQKLAPGTHIVTASNAADPPLSAIFTVAPLPGTQAFTWKLSWPHDGKSVREEVLDDLVFRVEIANTDNGPWVSAWDGSTLTASVQTPYAPACFRVFALYGGLQSAPSPVACSGASPPSAPGSVGAPREICLVAGGVRALYAISAKGSRGMKLGELDAGPASGDFQRFECSCTEGFMYGTTRYRKLPGRDAYVSGCASIGTH